MLSSSSCVTKKTPDNRGKYNSFKDYLHSSQAREPYDSKDSNSKKKVLFVLAAQETVERTGFDLSNYLALIDKLEKNDFSVSVRFEKNLAEIKAVLRQFEPKSLDILVLGGHGNPYVIDFGGNYLTTQEITDFSKNIALLKDKGLIILSSCSTGRDPRHESWISWLINDRSIASKLSCASGFEVVAPVRDMPGLDILINDGKYRGRYPDGDYLIPAIRFNCDSFKYEDDLTNEARSHMLNDLDLYFACAENDHKRAIELIHSGAAVNKADTIGLTPLHSAARSGDSLLVKELIKAGADVNKQTINGLAPIHIATNYGNISALRELIKAGADVNITDQAGKSPLYIAVDKDRELAVEELIRAHADVNREDADGNTALHLAVSNDDLWSVQKLIQLGADTHKANKKGLTPLDIARQKGFERTEEYLKYLNGLEKKH